ncbi:hypothetical protein [Embleya sp. NBC_00896]|uniref:hypothetical protein n=1 Tax=Embleya sp. NBC_00896 TaxID=2975961 RepID=UPI003868DD59|nr:hypothetical protein OG928_29485 [Embleya sp. NBC_00896]
MNNDLALLVPAGLVAGYFVLGSLSKRPASPAEFAAAKAAAALPINLYQAAEYAVPKVSPRELAVGRLHEAGLVFVSRRRVVRALDRHRKPTDDPVQVALYALLLEDFHEGLTFEEIDRSEAFKAALHEHAPPLLVRLPPTHGGRHKRMLRLAITSAALLPGLTAWAVAVACGLGGWLPWAMAGILTVAVWPLPLAVAGLAIGSFPKPRTDPDAVAPLVARCSAIVQAALEHPEAPADSEPEVASSEGAHGCLG